MSIENRRHDRRMRFPGLVMLLLGLAGCAALDSGPAVDPGAYYSHERALQLLHEGRERQARALVIERLDAEPDDEQARDLLEQIEAPPDDVLGAEYVVHEVQPGETLTILAERYLGDADRFYILARYNGIDRPARLRVDQELRIPRRYAEAADGGDLEVEAPRAAERAYARGRAALAAGDATAAASAFAEALAHDADHGAARSELRDLRANVAPNLHREAVLLYRNQALDEAIELWDRALAIDPDFERARDYRSRAVELRSRLDEVD